MTSPYLNHPVSSWRKITDKLLKSHPLKPALILDIAVRSWSAVWNTRVGVGPTSVELKELDVPATVVGYFFEVLFARELETRFPGTWRGCRQGEDKDLVHIPNPDYSVEIKTSGQRGLRVYGNRSYGQQIQNQQLAKKEKSGFYITVNFYKWNLSLIRFGWIDATDWKAQASPTGQMAGLPDDVYVNKLIPITGPYQLMATIGIVPGIGAKTLLDLTEKGITTVGDLLKYKGTLPAKILRIRDAIIPKYDSK